MRCTLSFRCEDIGMECTFVTQAETQAGLLDKISKHAESVHGLKEIPNELMVKIKGATKK